MTGKDAEFFPPNDEQHVKTTTFESLITMTIIPVINGKKQKEQFQFDKTMNITVAEAASTIAVHYGINTKDIKIRIPDENDNPLYTVAESTYLSKIGDSSLLYAVFNLPK